MYWYQTEQSPGFLAVFGACKKRRVNVSIGSFTYATTFYKVVPAAHTRMIHGMCFSTQHRIVSFPGDLLVLYDISKTQIFTHIDQKVILIDQ